MNERRKWDKRPIKRKGKEKRNKKEREENRIKTLRAP